MYSPEVTKTLRRSACQFKKFFGVSKRTFFQLLGIIRIADSMRHKFGGRPSRIPLENKLLWTLQYWCEYHTIEHLAYEYNTVVSHIYNEIIWIEKTLIQDDTFCLQGKQILQKNKSPYQIVDENVTELSAEHPKKTK